MQGCVCAHIVANQRTVLLIKYFGLSNGIATPHKALEAAPSPKVPAPSGRAKTPRRPPIHRLGVALGTGKLPAARRW